MKISGSFTDETLTQTSRHNFLQVYVDSSWETQGRLAGARGNKSDKEMKRRWFTSKAEKSYL